MRLAGSTLPPGLVSRRFFGAVLGRNAAKTRVMEVMAMTVGWKKPEDLGNPRREEDVAPVWKWFSILFCFLELEEANYKLSRY